MEKIVEQGLLYDFYGELLTAHQRQVYEDAVYHDMSLAEIADIRGISRQGVHDLIRRCDKILEQYEAQLGLVKKFALIKEKVQRIDALAEGLLEQEEQDVLTKELPEEESGEAQRKEMPEQEEFRNRQENLPEQEQRGERTAEHGTAVERLAAIRRLSGEILEEL